jgi:NitT/TauT family transport system substrate-binding protein
MAGRRARRGSTSQVVLNASRRSAGIGPIEGQWVAAGSVENGLAALRGGGVDAAFTQSPTYQTDPAPYKIVFWVDQYVSDFTLVLTVATPEVLESKPDAVRRYLAARQKAVDFIYANPAESAQIMATGLRVPLAAAKTTVKQYNDNKQWTAYGLSVNGINSAVDVAISVGALKPDAKIPWTKMIDQQFIPKDQQIDVGQLKNGG